MRSPTIVADSPPVAAVALKDRSNIISSDLLAGSADPSEKKSIMRSPPNSRIDSIPNIRFVRIRSKRNSS